MKKDGFSIRFLTIVIWNLEKWKSQKLKNGNFENPFIVNQTFSQTEIIKGKSDFAYIMHFQSTKCLIFVKFENISHWKMISIEFRKNFTGLSFCGRWVKKLQTFTRHLFWYRLSKIVMSSLLLFLCACFYVDLDNFGCECWRVETSAGFLKSVVLQLFPK